MFVFEKKLRFTITLTIFAFRSINGNRLRYWRLAHFLEKFYPSSAHHKSLPHDTAHLWLPHNVIQAREPCENDVVPCPANFAVLGLVISVLLILMNIEKYSHTYCTAIRDALEHLLTAVGVPTSHYIVPSKW